MQGILTDRTRRFVLTAAFCAVAFVVGMNAAIYTARSPFGRFPAWEQEVLSLVGAIAFFCMIDLSLKKTPEMVRKAVSGPVATTFVIAFVAFLAPWTHR